MGTSFVRHIRSLILASLVPVSWPVLGKTSECTAWITQNKIDLQAATCEFDCAIPRVDMATFSCPTECQSRCQNKKPARDLCRFPQPRNCEFYSSCVEEKYKCGSAGYPLAYGEKYCKRFSSLSSGDLSTKGLKWRDSTLLCLQNKLSDLLFTSNSVNTCPDLKAYAFNTHKACYTQKGQSVCDLGLSDMTTIVRVVDSSDLVSKASFVQIQAVLKTCIAGAQIQLNQLRRAAHAPMIWTVSSNDHSENLERRILELEEKLEYLHSLP